MHTKLTLCLSLHYTFPNNEGLHNLIHVAGNFSVPENKIVGACAGGVQALDYRSIEQDQQLIATQWARAAYVSHQRMLHFVLSVSIQLCCKLWLRSLGCGSRS